ncbi:hypothetical protein PJ267_19695 [Arthrobacter sp. OVS8]|nr:hypothetical protein PJ267_19695 [Arthrobacter sp. OVS8]
MTAAVVLAAGVTLSASYALSRAKARLREEQRRTGAKEAELQALLADSRERERLLNTILDTVDVGIVAVDAAGRRLLTNSWQSALEESAAPDGAAQEAGEARLLLTGQDQATPLPSNGAPSGGPRPASPSRTTSCVSARLRAAAWCRRAHGRCGMTPAASAAPSLSSTRSPGWSMPWPSRTTSSPPSPTSSGPR